jgi:hypothetical protein
MQRNIIFLTIFILVFTTPAFGYLDVPQLDQDQITAVTQYQYICGPTVATEVIGYWTQHGYPDLMNGMPSGIVPDMSQPILDLFLSMADTYSGYNGSYTYPDKLTRGMKQYFNDKGYDVDVILSAEGATKWSAVKAEINAGRPVIMLLLDLDHYVVVIGYTNTPPTFTALVGHVPLVQTWDVSAIPTSQVQTIFVRPQPGEGTSVLTVTKSGSGTGSVTSAPSGINCGTDCTETYSRGTTVTLTANPDTGSVFGGWSGECRGTDSECAVTVNGNTTVTATFYLPPRISVNEGTIGTQLTITGSDFGTKKGKVIIENAATRIFDWSPSSITCEINKPLPPGSYNIVVKPTEPRGTPPITCQGAFTMLAPEIGTVVPFTGAEDAVIEISGNFFSTKKGKVYLDEKKCKVLSWTMDATSGNSNIQFVVPKKMSSGSYKVTVSNKVGSDTLADWFTIIIP